VWTGHDHQPFQMAFGHPPSLIRTALYFYHRATNLRDQPLNARKDCLDSNEYEDALSSLLKELYELVGRPVVQRLNESSVPEQSRVWWCSTSVWFLVSLCSFTRRSDPIRRRPSAIFFGPYTRSYTLTLSTLIESRYTCSLTLGKPSVLLVSLP
jgi:hypothetical protein